MSFKVKLKKQKVLGYNFCLLEAFISLYLVQRSWLSVFHVLMWKKVYLPLAILLCPLKWKKRKTTQRTNQGIPLWANLWVVSLGPSVYLMMDCSATLQNWENPSSLSAQTTYTSVIALLKGKGELFHMKIGQPSKNSGRSSCKQQLVSSHAFKERCEFEDLGGCQNDPLVWFD